MVLFLFVLCTRLQLIFLSKPALCAHLYEPYLLCIKRDKLCNNVQLYFWASSIEIEFWFSSRSQHCGENYTPNLIYNKIAFVIANSSLHRNHRIVCLQLKAMRIFISSYITPLLIVLKLFEDCKVIKLKLEVLVQFREDVSRFVSLFVFQPILAIELQVCFVVCIEHMKTIIWRQ